MKRIPELLKSSIIAGLLIVLPAWLAILMLGKVLMHFGGMVKPVSRLIPEDILHPHLVAAILFLLACLFVGMLSQTPLGRVIGRSLEYNVFGRVPGYHAFRKIAHQFSDKDAGHGFKPALIDVEDGCLTPAFVIEEHANGSFTVFLPSVPTPMAGSILIMPAERIHRIDVPVSSMMKCISQWGGGSTELIAALEKSRHASPKNSN